jgi:hypothetical protein
MHDEPHPDPLAPGGAARAARIALASAGGALALFAALLATGLSAHRELQVDEIEHVKAAYNRSQGQRLYADFWQGHHPGIYLLLTPLVDPEQPRASFARARALMLATWCVSLLLAGLCAARLAGRAEAGALAAGLLALHTTFVERGLEIRPDGLLAAFALGALALELYESRAPRRACGQAVLLALAFLCTNKAVLVCGAFGVLWALAALRARRPALLLAPCAVFALPLAAALAWLAATGALESFWLYNVRNQFQVVARSALVETGFGAWRFVRQESARNGIFCAALLAGGAALLVRCVRPGAAPGLRASVWIACAALSSLWVVPHPFPYQHVAVLPLLAIAAAAGCAGLAVRFTRSPLVLGAGVVLLLSGAAAGSAPRLLAKARQTHAQQLATVERIGRLALPDEPVFDLVGLYFRPDAYPIYLMTGAHFARYLAGGFPPIAATLQRTRPVVIGLNYRTSWLRGADRQFILEHYTHYDSSLFVPGRRLERLDPGEAQVFEVLRAKSFVYRGDGVLRVDGRPFERGVLEAGVHRLDSETGIRAGLLVQDFPEPPPLEPAAVPALYTPFD